MRPSAAGVVLLILPDPGGLGWMVAGFTQSGRWKCTTTGFATRWAAREHRRKLLAHHKRLARSRTTAKES